MNLLCSMNICNNNANISKLPSNVMSLNIESVIEKNGFIRILIYENQFALEHSKKINSRQLTSVKNIFEDEFCSSKNNKTDVYIVIENIHSKDFKILHSEK